MKMSGSSRKVVREAFSVNVICFLLLLSLANCSARRNTVTIPSSRGVGKFKPVETAEINGLYRNFKLKGVSKRRVPNGPDPIHNRKVGNTELPPT